MELEFAGEISTPSHRRRQICDNCNRPTPVCLCHVIPSSPIPTSTQIIVIQHPHESQHKLNTAHLLTKSLLNAATIIARRLTPNLLHPIFAGDNPPPPMFYLFPHTPSSAAVPLSELKAEKGRLVLIVFDATWKHAKEMVKASEGFLSKLATRVCLDGFDKEVEGESIYESELVLRKEPWGGCVSTMEAVARWLGAVEEGGAAVEETLVGVLKEAVKLQAQFLKPMKPRPKLLKKNKRHQF
ncbi:hypothetical protein K2173_024173 [Erythroxylum novogranatense]|uniref:tRNA-uridine aminocarboxypropyltransferase n=1 Tax=Erythroxylum novogranatense TaxID=1862640 RepID=A0AAV8UFG1_9ROSI|nr:hypothetical protein K2173_024173 [Erythroxylum novogranatense]